MRAIEEMLRRQKEAKQKELEESIERAWTACKEKQEREGLNPGEVFAIDLPEQSLKSGSKDNAEYVIRTLRSLGVRGTYRVILDNGQPTKTSNDMRGK